MEKSNEAAYNAAEVVVILAGLDAAAHDAACLARAAADHAASAAAVAAAEPLKLKGDEK